MIELMKDRHGEPVFEDDYILFGVKTSGMGQDGEMRVGKVTGKTGHGIGVDSYPYRFKVSHKIVKVHPDFALAFIEYTK